MRCGDEPLFSFCTAEYRHKLVGGLQSVSVRRRCSSFQPGRHVWSGADASGKTVECRWSGVGKEHLCVHVCVGESGFAAKVAAPQRRINPPTRPTDP